MSAHDLVIRGGRVVDGTGEREIDADGALVTPGFVDIHTHYDGQATWDEQLRPSCWHGVTTVVMGNCGVGFAPVAPDRHEWLIGLMEGVEDIPGAALAAGITWGWESFPEFLDALDGRRHVMDLGTQVPHGAVRGYVMGERGARNEPASSDDIEAMAAIVRQGIEAGALWTWETGETVALPFVSVQHIVDGVIFLWKDYWDFQTLMGAAPAAWHDRLDTAERSWVVDVTGRA